ncbi:MAG: hypothetical protein IKN12_06480 [Selenomonadaceae bacterium]|nr:hypothetical protein [Selenomonadaceae bacterium]MBR3624582.1 hypothetical protein [Selenomonadaceae bacterium]MBR3722397.1 hypothetical protein [Selenomonadaceae bacterium]
MREIVNGRMVMPEEPKGSARKIRSPQEIMARYNLKLNQYKELRMHGETPGNHEQIVMIYSEIKALGWILGKDEKTIIKESCV